MVSDSATAPNPKCCPHWNHSMSFSVSWTPGAEQWQKSFIQGQTHTTKGLRAWTQIKKLPKGIILQSMPLLPIEEFYSFISEFYSSLQDKVQIKWMLSRNILPHHQEQSLALLPGILIWGWDYVTLGYREYIQPYSRASEDNKSVGNIYKFKKDN